MNVLANSPEFSEKDSPRAEAEKAAAQLLGKGLRAEVRGQTEAFSKSLADRVERRPPENPSPVKGRVTTERDSLYCLCGALRADPPSEGCSAKTQHPSAASSVEEKGKLDALEKRKLVLAPLFKTAAGKSLRQKMIAKEEK